MKKTTTIAASPSTVINDTARAPPRILAKKPRWTNPSWPTPMHVVKAPIMRERISGSADM